MFAQVQYAILYQTIAQKKLNALSTIVLQNTQTMMLPNRLCRSNMQCRNNNMHAKILGFSSLLLQQMIYANEPTPPVVKSLRELCIEKIVTHRINAKVLSSVYQFDIESKDKEYRQKRADLYQSLERSLEREIHMLPYPFCSLKPIPVAPITLDLIAQSTDQPESCSAHCISKMAKHNINPYCITHNTLSICCWGCLGMFGVTAFTLAGSFCFNPIQLKAALIATECSMGLLALNCVCKCPLLAYSKKCTQQCYAHLIPKPDLEPITDCALDD